MQKRIDWDAVQQYHDEGRSMHECAKRFGFKLAAWYKAARRDSLEPRPFDNRRYDWRSIQEYYDEGHTYAECKAKFGFGRDTWGYAVRRGAMRARGNRVPLKLLLARGKYGSSIKYRLIAEGLLQNKCQECGLCEWRGKPLSVQMDHINGDSTDHRLDNLRMLCPNCHSQTDTFGTRNWIYRRKALQEAGERM